MDIHSMLLFFGWALNSAGRSPSNFNQKKLGFIE